MRLNTVPRRSSALELKSEFLREQLAAISPPSLSVLLLSLLLSAGAPSAAKSTAGCSAALQHPQVAQGLGHIALLPQREVQWHQQTGPNLLLPTGKLLRTSEATAGPLTHGFGQLEHLQVFTI